MARSAVLSIVLGNIVSKGFGVLREVLFAGWFGTGETAAAFRIAQTGFLMPTHTFVGDTLSAGLLPLYRQLQRDGRGAHRVLLLVASFYGLLFSAVVTTTLYVYAGAVPAFVAPGASSQALELAGSLLRVLALATPFYVLSGILSYIGTAYGQFGAIAWRPLLLNIGSTVGVALAVLMKRDHWLATSLLFAHIAFFVWTTMAQSRLDRLLPDTRPAWTALQTIGRRFLRNTLPLLGLPLIIQLNFLVERVVSSWLGTEVIPSVDYARFIADTSVQLVAMPLGVLTMSSHGGLATAEAQSHSRTIATTVMLLSFPLGGFVGQNAEAVTRLLFARGAFDADSVATTSSILMWMGYSLGTTVTSYYLVKALNAQLRNLEALTCTVAACLANMLVNLLLWRALGTATIGIAAAIYSGVLFLLCLARHGFLHSALPLLGWIGFGIGMQFAAGVVLSTCLSYPLNMLANAGVCTAIWLGLIAAVPRLHQAAEPVLSHTRRPRGGRCRGPCDTAMGRGRHRDETDRPARYAE